MLFDPRQDQTSRDILAAAEIIKRDGWCQNRLWGPGTSVCMSGALVVAIAGGRNFNLLADDIWVGTERLHKAQKHLERHLGICDCPDTGVSTIPFWNDTAGRTKEEVIKAMCESVGVTEDVLV